MRRRFVFALVASVLLANTGRSQCHEWAHDFALGGLDGPVHAYATFDEGHGPVLFVGGDFQHAGEQFVSSVARWDGTHWSSVGGGVDGAVRALAIYDDGSGPALYAAGNIYHAGGSIAGGIAKWDGTSWSPLVSGGVNGVSGMVFALAVYDSGSGPKLYAAGSFLNAGGQLANNIARWGPSGWEAFTNGAAGYPQALTVFDDGSGPKLIVAGQFPQIGSVFVNNIASYDGSVFAPLGAGADGLVRALHVFHGSAGPELVAAGGFTHAGGANAGGIASWSSGSWSPLGSGLAGNAWTLATFDEGAGERLFVGGPFTQAGGQPLAHLARWDGAAWSALGSGDQVSPSAAVPGLGVHDDGSGPALYVGTDVRTGLSTWTHGIGRWNGTDFSAVGPARNNLIDGAAMSFAVFDDGSGAALHAAGFFGKAGGNQVNGIARWNGARWKGLGAGLGIGYPPLTVVHHASGERLYAPRIQWSGSTPYSELRRWDGLAWTTVASTPAGTQIAALGAYDDGNGEALYVGGNFTSIGSITAHGIARFDGNNWSALGSGISGASPYWSVGVLASEDFGSGPVLVAGGFFDTAGGQPAQNIARWNGSSWSPLGAGLQAQPVSLASFDDGSGPALFAGCEPSAQGQLQRWNGSSWSSVALGPDNWIDALAVFDDGSGPALYAGGNFTHVGPTPAAGFARWNGSQWNVPGGGVMLGTSTGGVFALQVFDDGTGGGPDLYLGGNFTTSGGVLSPYIAKWRGCAASIASFCVGDGSDFPCPCWNSGASGRGCANSANAAGAQLSWSGSTNPDTLVLASSGELATALSVVLQGNAQQPHAAFGDGLRCVSGSLKRLFVRNASGGNVSAPIAGEPSIRARSAALGDPISAGTARFYQVYYRDPQLAFCPAPAGSSWNVTNGVVVNW